MRGSRLWALAGLVCASTSLTACAPDLRVQAEQALQQRISEIAEDAAELHALNADDALAAVRSGTIDGLDVAVEDGFPSKTEGPGHGVYAGLYDAGTRSGTVRLSVALGVQRVTSGFAGEKYEWLYTCVVFTPSEQPSRVGCPPDVEEGPFRDSRWSEAQVP